MQFELNIRKAYFNEGYLYTTADINIQTSAERKVTNTIVVVEIKEGVRAKIGDIRIVGLSRTDPKVVRRELRFFTGDPYSPEDIENSRQALLSLAIFRSVQILPTDRDAVVFNESVTEWTHWQYLWTPTDFAGGSKSLPPACSQTPAEPVLRPIR